ncbi:MAG TPA: SDR family oxidoreductase [Candidatus Competibacteraceae bacterium]|nr:SDR family oxidoreductase [Candidatus Competibacteraceae bacterium]
MSQIPVVVVTGAAQGIGKGTSRYLLERGYTVIMVDKNREAGEQTLAEYRPLASRSELHFVCADVSQEEAVVAALQFVAERCDTLAGLVNNAAIANQNTGPIEQLSLSEWNRYIGNNLTSAFLMVKHAAPLLRQGKGAIVNIASTRAFQSEPDSEAYAACKGGIVSLTHALAMSLGPAIRVNCISPGWIDVRAWRQVPPQPLEPLSETDQRQHPVGRVGQPEDIAALVAFLLSAEAGFITGQNFIVDGGMTRKMIYS